MEIDGGCGNHSTILVTCLYRLSGIEKRRNKISKALANAGSSLYCANEAAFVAFKYVKGHVELAFPEFEGIKAVAEKSILIENLVDLLLSH